MKILVFGMLVEDVGADELQVDLQPDLDSLRELLLRNYPSLKSRQFMVAVNKHKTSENVVLNPNDEIALIPPFAGG